MTNIKTLGDLKKSGWVSKSIKDEIRDNLISKLTNKENPFPGILGYEDTVIPETERALLNKHNIFFTCINFCMLSVFVYALIKQQQSITWS